MSSSWKPETVSAFAKDMRRNPDDYQDSDYSDDDYWLTKLNKFNGDYVRAEMIKSFITSIEYRQRFGP